MIDHPVSVFRSRDPHSRDEELAWHIATVAADPVEVSPAATQMVINRIIDVVAVSMAALSRAPVVAARDQALDRPIGPRGPGAQVFGTPSPTRVFPEWAAWANGVAVRELDFHDTFLAAEYSHPGDTIAPLLAVAQHRGSSGAELIRAIVTGYEIQVDLSSGICLHEHRIDHVAHLGPAVAAGLGTLLAAPTEVTYHAVGQALHTTTATRQSRKGQISSWKAYAPAFAGKVAIEAMDRALRGQQAPAPIYEGEDGVIAWLLSGPDVRYSVPLPGPGEPREAIMRTYPKQHSAEYQAQALIDLAIALRARVGDPGRIRSVLIRTSRHTHHVIGTGSNDPQKFDPDSSRETLDHSIMYIVAVALLDGRWHHEQSYPPHRPIDPRTLSLWRSISTREEPAWTRRYHATDPSERAFGGRLEITLEDGSVVTGERAVADAHPLGAAPFGRNDYVAKFRSLADGIVSAGEQDRFLDLVQRLPQIQADELADLVPVADLITLPSSPRGVL